LFKTILSCVLGLGCLALLADDASARGRGRGRGSGRNGGHRLHSRYYRQHAGHYRHRYWNRRWYNRGNRRWYNRQYLAYGGVGYGGDYSPYAPMVYGPGQCVYVPATVIILIDSQGAGLMGAPARSRVYNMRR
jgi:hypothetical protein